MRLYRIRWAENCYEYVFGYKRLGKAFMPSHTIQKCFHNLESAIITRLKPNPKAFWLCLRHTKTNHYIYV